MTIKENKEDRDFGFPFVDVKPINLENKENLASIEIEDQDEKLNDDYLEAIASENLSEKRPNRSFGWILWTFIFLILLALAAYFLYDSGLYTKFTDRLFSTQESINSEPLPIFQDDSVLDMEGLEEDQSIIAPEIEEIEGVAQTPELNKNDIIPIKEKVLGRYFIVVSSLINENLAITEAEKYKGKSPNVYVIYPYGNIPNFRIAIGKYDTIDAALEDLEKTKIEINNSSWILKY
jgi:hypothetical protein